jgi:hypothetical protein
MKKFDNLEDAALAIGDGGPFSSDTVHKTVGEFVDALVEIGNTDKVFVRHDDHLGLKDDLSSELLALPLNDVPEEKYEDQIENILDQANIIIPLSGRELSEDDHEEIEEDRMYRGDTDD